jgi:para-aminobenzoate synthetase component 1
MSNRRFQISDLRDIKQKLYHFSESFSHAHLYDSNEAVMAENYGKYEFLGAFGLKNLLPMDSNGLFEHIGKHQAWIFGHLDYQDIAEADLCKGFFYEPMMVFYIEQGKDVVEVVNNGIEPSVFDQWMSVFEETIPLKRQPLPMPVDFIAQTSRAHYLDTVSRIREDIIRGKYYEMNYCIEFSSFCATGDLLPYFNQLNQTAAAPFSAFAKTPDFTVMCSSPERFLMQRADLLVSQPIKGTNKRLLEYEANLVQMDSLRASEKERAENVMIVDLVRNDLARVCETGSVKVEELCGVYAFRTVNHLVSTISGKKTRPSGFKEVMWSLFPMGSMTGAPKTEVMKHIGLYEHDARGIYSGCMGYIEPGGDFDFNVLIRSLVYDPAQQQISYKVGSAITYDSVPEDEYEECLLKGRRLFDVMSGKDH